MCEYCEEKKELTNDLFRIKTYIDDLFRRKTFFVKDEHQVLKSFSINYCPMCGQKLNKKEGDN